MIEIKVKRVYEPGEASDGFRVLVDKLWPRGIKKEALHCDLWAKDIAPSTPLRKWYHEEVESRWREFERRYTEELENSAAVEEFMTRMAEEKTITLLYAAKTTGRNHALVLRDFLKKHI